MSSAGSVTTWIGQLQAGEEAALANLHARYWPRLVAFARHKLNGFPARAADEEDVAQEAFLGFYRRIKEGKTLQLTNRHDLFALLTKITACRVANLIEHECAAKRGGGRVHDESALDRLLCVTPGERGLERIEGARQSPLQVEMLHEDYCRYLDALPEPVRAFAQLHLAGFTNKEIATRLECVERTVERKLERAREAWEELARADVCRLPRRSAARKATTPP